jgi:hypothetical protein
MRPDGRDFFAISAPMDDLHQRIIHSSRLLLLHANLFLWNDVLWRMDICVHSCAKHI